MSVKRIYVEKKAPYAVEAKQLLWEIRHILQIKTVTGLRLLNRYDVEGVDDALYQKCLPVVFSEPQVDVTYTELPHGAKAVFAVEYLPGQYDQRAASCEECIQLVGQCARPTVRSARVYLLDGDFTADELARVKKHVINPVEAREADLGEKTTLQQQYDTPDHVETLTGFTAMNADEVDAFVKKYGLAMDDDDLAFCRDYFASEHRDPTLTEIRMIDTYWSDHCRHTTFLTTLDAVDVRKAAVEKAFQRYLAARKTVYGDRARPMNLMDIATIGGKYLKKIGQTPNIDVSEEINACSIKIDVDVDGVKEPWLLMFKNETHNHPTEIEPFGGAATCIGGAIRDPLSGRTYVYQAMRVTGAADPLVPVSQTMRRRAIPPMATRLDWRRGWWMKCTIRAMPPSVWKSARWSALRRRRTSAAKCLPPATRLSCSAGAPGATAAAAQRVRPSPISWNPSKRAARRCRRAMPRPNASSSASSATAKSPASSSAATTSARAACPWQSANWRTA